jgi:hypothetical protein
MKIYFAGTPGIESREREWQRILKRRLLSYWDIQQGQFSVPFAFKLIKEKYENLSGRSAGRGLSRERL